MISEVIATFVLGAAASGIASFLFDQAKDLLARRRGGTADRPSDAANEIVAEARNALRARAYTPAVYLSLAAVEAELARFAPRAAHVQSIRELLATVVAQHALSKDLADQVAQLSQQRDALLHSTPDTAVTPDEARETVHRAETIISQLHEAAA